MARGRRHSKKSKKGAAAAPPEETDPSKIPPKSFVFERSALDKSALQLMQDVRQVMMPHTASKLRVRRTNVLKDFVNVAGPLHISHFLMFSRSETGLNFRVGRVPHGPTLTFRVLSYTLAGKVMAAQARPKAITNQLLTPPLLVLNNFNKEGAEFKLMAQVLQNMFPSINVTTVDVSTIRRVCLFSYDDATGTIDFRHYNISVRPVGISRSVREVLSNRPPDLSQFQDISDFVLRNSAAYESDAELAGDNRVTLPKDMGGAGNVASSQSAVKLTEMGPRMSLKLMKIEEGLCEGKTLHHAYKDKDQERERHKKEMLRIRRRQEQEKNVQRKALEKEAHKEKSLQGMLAKAARTTDGDDGDAATASGADDDYDADGLGAAPDQMADDDGNDEEDDDAAYYRQEVGEEPPPDLLLESAAAPLKYNKHAKPAGLARKRAEAAGGAGGGGESRARGASGGGREGGGPQAKRGKRKDETESHDRDGSRRGSDKGSKPQRRPGKAGGAAPSANPRKLSKRDFRAQAKAKRQSERDRKRAAHNAGAH